jgi:hypothetical protein
MNDQDCWPSTVLRQFSSDRLHRRCIVAMIGNVEGEAVWILVKLVIDGSSL